MKRFTTHARSAAVDSIHGSAPRSVGPLRRRQQDACTKDVKRSKETRAPRPPGTTADEGGTGRRPGATPRTKARPKDLRGDGRRGRHRRRRRRPDGPSASRSRRNCCAPASGSPALLPPVAITRAGHPGCHDAGLLRGTRRRRAAAGRGRGAGRGRRTAPGGRPSAADESKREGREEARRKEKKQEGQGDHPLLATLNV